MPVRHLLATVALAGTLLASPQWADPAAAAVTDIPVNQWNMCGQVCYAGSATPADVVHFAVGIANPRPWTVSLNEVCFNSNQRSRLINTLGDLGYNSFHYTARSSVAGCGGTAFGNLIFAIGPRINQSSTAFATQDPNSLERRGVTCVRNGNFGFNHTGCSAHLDNPVNNSIALAQEDQLYNYIKFSISNQAVKLVGGDFNITPDRSDFNKWRTDFDEIDEAQPWQATMDNGQKRDYIWVRDYVGEFTSPYAVGLADIQTGNPEADHHYYSGRFRWSH